MSEIIKQSLEELIAERDRLIAENATLKSTAFFEQSVSKTIYDRLKSAYDAVARDNAKLNDAIDVQASRIAELTRVVADLRKQIYSEVEE